MEKELITPALCVMLKEPYWGKNMQMLGIKYMNLINTLWKKITLIYGAGRGIGKQIAIKRVKGAGRISLRSVVRFPLFISLI